MYKHSKMYPGRKKILDICDNTKVWSSPLTVDFIFSIQIIVYNFSEIKKT